MTLPSLHKTTPSVHHQTTPTQPKLFLHGFSTAENSETWADLFTTFYMCIPSKPIPYSPSREARVFPAASQARTALAGRARERSGRCSPGGSIPGPRDVSPMPGAGFCRDPHDLFSGRAHRPRFCRRLRWTFRREATRSRIIKRREPRGRDFGD